MNPLALARIRQKFPRPRIDNLPAVIKKGKPPALPGDSQSLTFPGFFLSYPAVDRSKYTARKA
jgi:hypothetical protein